MCAAHQLKSLAALLLALSVPLTHAQVEDELERRVFEEAERFADGLFGDTLRPRSDEKADTRPDCEKAREAEMTMAGGIDEAAESIDTLKRAEAEGAEAGALVSECRAGSDSMRCKVAVRQQMRRLTKLLAEYKPGSEYVETARLVDHHCGTQLIDLIDINAPQIFEARAITMRIFNVDENGNVRTPD